MKPIVHLLHGFMGSGKTTFARKLERDCSAVRISHDEWTVRLHGWNPPEEHFSEYKSQVDRLIWREASQLIDAGADVVLDHGFWTRESRDAARSWAQKVGATPMFYDVVCPRVIMRSRVLERSKSPKTDSLWIDGSGFDKLFTGFEPMGTDEESIRIDGTGSVELLEGQ